MKLSNRLDKHTVMIKCNNGSVGTGFFYGVEHHSGVGHNFFIVTNKHVVKDAASAMLMTRMANAGTGDIENNKSVLIEDLQTILIPHPGDVDLCAIPINKAIIEFQKNNMTLHFFPFFQSECYEHYEHKSSLTSVEDVFMTGYPTALWDHVNNKPITRKGITASDCKENWQGKKEFLIDMACFPGSSGSPVYIYNNGTIMIDGDVFGGERLILLGILRAGSLFEAGGRVEITNVPSSVKAISETRIPMNLGVVIKAEELGFLRDKRV
ncbi:TPA: S1 family peptidase [Klebsiella quasipneumoniae subsp. quasipneumoniae]